MLCLPFEQFVSDGPAFVRAIVRFAGTAQGDGALDGLPFDNRSNRAPSTVGTERRRLRNKLGVRSELNPTPVFGPKAFATIPPELLERAIRPRAGAEELERRLRETVDAFVGDRYAESNRRTAELARVDLAALGWTL